MLATQHKGAIVRCNVGDHRQSFRIYDENLMTVPVLHFDVIFGDELILCGVEYKETFPDNEKVL